MDGVYDELAALLEPEKGRGMGGWLFGEVLKAGRGELNVACNGLSLDQTGIHIPPGLDYGWEEDDGGESLLRAGERLIVLVSADGQDYYALGKAAFG